MGKDIHTTCIHVYTSQDRKSRQTDSNTVVRMTSFIKILQLRGIGRGKGAGMEVKKCQNTKHGFCELKKLSLSPPHGFFPAAFTFVGHLFWEEQTGMKEFKSAQRSRSNRTLGNICKRLKRTCNTHTFMTFTTITSSGSIGKDNLKIELSQWKPSLQSHH